MALKPPAPIAPVKKPTGRNRTLPGIDLAEITEMLGPVAKTLPPSRVAVVEDVTPVIVIDADVLPPVLPADLHTADDYVVEVERLWRASQDHAVDIGRRLNEAKNRLEHGEFMTMTARRLPFSHSVANRLMRVASAVDSGRYPLERLPANYTIVDQLVTLSADEWQEAESQGVVRPDVTVREVADFKRRIRSRRATITDDPQTAVGAAHLRKRLTRLLAQREKLEIEIEALRVQLDED